MQYQVIMKKFIKIKNLDFQIPKLYPSKTTLLMLCMCVVVINITIAQNFEWAKKIANSSGHGMEYSAAIKVDGSGNVYTTGHFTHTVDFDPGPGVFNLTTYGMSAGYFGDMDIFISKLDASGNFVWAKQIGRGTTTTSESAASMVLDHSGYIYIVGIFSGTMDFDPGPGIFNLTSAGPSASFVLKLDYNGNFVWAKQMSEHAASCSANSVVLDGLGNICITGTFNGTVDFDPGPGTLMLNTAGGNDIYITKLDANGNLIWVKQIGGTENDNTNAIATDASGNIYAVGNFTGAVDFDPGSGVFNLSSNPSYGQDAFILKLDPSGNFVWAKDFAGGHGSAENKSLIIDNAGNIFITGHFKSLVDFDPGPGVFNMNTVTSISPVSNDIFIVKLDGGGNFIWAKQIGTSDFDEIGNYITIDNIGNIYITGTYEGLTDFDPGPGVFNLTGLSMERIFVSKYDNNGNFIWAVTLCRNHYFSSSSYHNSAIDIDAAGYVYTTGEFTENSDFDPGPGVFILNVTANNYPDMFVHKMSQSPSGIQDANNYEVPVKIYPNPSTGMFYLNYTENHQVNFVITDVLGKSIQTGVLNNGINLVSLQNAPVGIYLMRIEDKVIKLIKE